ncbi:hypothetical protein BUALT_Bualt12G0119100 [Buddleja alternifolia]|uniref:Uncharacterized protein n=1 Tax=Buddleja alternifolia TaxID=168488 RepID=A0AAV6X196_9LAMI|nr:hypothetical protein BUALT_Bualt12G0119100 [Buddleja alternifolia]
MALKFIVLVIVAAITLQMAEAQSGVNAKGITFDLFGVPVTLYCTPDGNMGNFGPAAPPFRGAEVQLQCGNSEIIANSTTNSFGITYLVTEAAPVFSFFPPQFNCKIVVDTKLSSCNATLPFIGFLESPLEFVGTYLQKNLKIANFSPTGFSYNPGL